MFLYLMLVTEVYNYCGVDIVHTRMEEGWERYICGKMGKSGEEGDGFGRL